MLLMIKKFNVCVLPGFEDVRARFLRLIILLIKLDFPTFDLPANANSGMGAFGYCSGLTALMTMSELVTFIYFHLPMHVQELRLILKQEQILSRCGHFQVYHQYPFHYPLE